jgi:hypothetical protein
MSTDRRIAALQRRPANGMTDHHCIATFDVNTLFTFNYLEHNHISGLNIAIGEMVLTGQSGASDDRVEQRRSAARHKLFEPVTMEVHGMPFRAHLLDLSCSGALAHAEMPPLPGGRLVTMLSGFAMRGRVIWVRGKRFGLRFDHCLSGAMVDRLIGMGDPALRARPVQPLSASPRF